MKKLISIILFCFSSTAFALPWWLSPNSPYAGLHLPAAFVVNTEKEHILVCIERHGNTAFPSAIVVNDKVKAIELAARINNSEDSCSLLDTYSDNK